MTRWLFVSFCVMTLGYFGLIPQAFDVSLFFSRMIYSTKLDGFTSFRVHCGVMGDPCAYSGLLCLPMFSWYVHIHFDFHKASENGAWGLISDDEWGMMPDVSLTTLSCFSFPCCYTGIATFMVLHILHVFVNHILRQWYWLTGRLWLCVFDLGWLGLVR